MSELKLKSKLFNIPQLINKYIKNGMQNILLYSSQGTGKSSIAIELGDYLVENRIVDMNFFIDAGIKFGVEEARLLIEKLEQYNSSITIFDEGIKITPEAQDALRSITNQPPHYFIICTNEINMMSEIIMDRFVKIDCNINMTDDLYNDVYEYFEDFHPNLVKIIEDSKVDWKEFFNYNFTGSMRDLIRKIENKDLNITKEPSIEYMVQSYQPSEIQKIVFNKWLKSNRDETILKEIMESSFRMSQVEFKRPFLYYLLSLRERL